MGNLSSWMNEFRALHLKVKKEYAKWPAWILSRHSVGQMPQEWGLSGADWAGGDGAGSTPPPLI